MNKESQTTLSMITAKLVMIIKGKLKMTYEEIKKLFHEIGERLLNYNVEKHFSEELVADILEIETALWRARIKILRTFSHND